MKINNVNIHQEIIIEAKIIVTDEDIDDIVCAALEGGINYWCTKVEIGDGEEYKGEFAHEQISNGGTLKIYDSIDNKWYLLDKDNLLNGIKLAIEGNFYSDYYWFSFDDGKLNPGQIDANVADVIMQLALWHSVEYD
jgi:hypothetical protein